MVLYNIIGPQRVKDIFINFTAADFLTKIYPKNSNIHHFITFDAFIHISERTQLKNQVIVAF